MQKLHQRARLRVYTTHTVSPSFVSAEIQRVIGRPVIELPNYIYAVNVLYQMRIHAKVDFIAGPNFQGNTDTFERFCESTSWSAGALNDEEQQRLFDYYHHQKKRGLTLASTTRDWALVSWEKGR